MNAENGTSVDKIRSKKQVDKSLNLEKQVPKFSNTLLSIDSTVINSSFKIEDAKNNKQNKNNFCPFIKGNKILIWVERVIVFSICTAVAGGFTVPIVIFAVNADRGNTTKLSSDLDFNICSNISVQVCS